MLKKVYVNTNSTIPTKTFIDGIVNIASNQLPNIQNNKHTKNALVIADSLSRLTEFRKDIRCRLQNCNCAEYLDTLKTYVIKNANSVMREADNVSMSSLLSAMQHKKLLLPNQFQNYVFARNYSSSSQSKCSKGSKDSEGGGGKKKDNLTAVLHAIDDLRLATRSGGVLVLIGMGEDEARLPIANALAREVDIRGIFRYCNDYKPALALVASKKVQEIKHMITHHYDIKDTEKAFTTVRCNEDGAIKVIIHVQPKDKNNPKKDGKKGGSGKKGGKKC